MEASLHEPAPSWRRVLREAAVLFVTWRVALMLFNLAGVGLMPERWPNPHKDWQAFENNVYWDAWCRWDGGWYARIVRHGYYWEGRQSNVAFYPLYPYLSRYLGRVVGSPFAAGLLISNLATWLGLAYFIRLGRLTASAAAVRRAAMFLLLFPGAFFLSAFYTEGLFFLTTAASLYYCATRRWLACGLAGMLAMLTRNQGLVLFAACVGGVLHARLAHGERLGARVLALGAIPLGLVIFMLLLTIQVGDPLAFLRAQGGWSAVHVTDIDLSLPSDADNTINLLGMMAALGFVFLALDMARRGYRTELWLYVLLSLALVLWVGRIYSLMRFCAVLFPVFYRLAELCEERPLLERWLLFASAYFLAIFNLRYMGWHWAG